MSNSMRITVLSASIALMALSANAHAIGACQYKPGQFKPYVSGNVARKFEMVSGASAKYLPYVDSIAVEARWKDLEPREGEYNFGNPGGDGNDAHYTFEEKLQHAARHGKKVRIRIFAGTYAPDFAKRAGGFTPIQWKNVDGQNNIQTLGPFWKQAYQTKWQNFQKELARRYNCDPRVNEVQISGTGTITPEVMLLQTRVEIRPGFTNGDSLRNAGFDDDQRTEMLIKDVHFMQDTWTHTHLTLWGHPYATLDGRKPNGFGETWRLIQSFHARRPGHVSFGHTGVGETILNGKDRPSTLAYYRKLADARMPISMQTQAIKVTSGSGLPGVGNIEYVMDRLSDYYNAGGFRAMGMELPTGWQRTKELSGNGALELMQDYNALMKSNANYQERLHQEIN